MQATDDEDRESMRAFNVDRNKKTDLTVWLRDFPRNASDFKEIRRSAAQHTPEVDIALHGAILIEEKFKRNYDEEPQVDPNAEISPE
jgi:hypothetical protein